MKHCILFIALLSGMTATATTISPTARDERTAAEIKSRTIHFEALPDAARSFIHDFYAQERVKRVRTDPTAKLFTYRVRFTNGDEIFFSRIGEWTEMECPKGVPAQLVPQEVKDYVKSKYPGRTITAIGLENNGISVSLSDHTELTVPSETDNLRTRMQKKQEDKTMKKEMKDEKHPHHRDHHGMSR